MGRDPPPLTGPVWMLVHDRTLVHLDDGLRGWRVVTQGTVWSDGVVMLSPAFDQYFGFFQCVEDLRIQQLIPELAVETFVVTIFPRTARGYEQRLHADPAQPVSDSMGRELGPIVRADVIQWTVPDE